jgi:hypothetical protein
LSGARPIAPGRLQHPEASERPDRLRGAVDDRGIGRIGLPGQWRERDIAGRRAGAPHAGRGSIGVEASDDPRISRLDPRVRHEVHARAPMQTVSVSPREPERRISQIGGEARAVGTERREIARVEGDGEAVGDDRPVARLDASSLHLALDATQQLDRLDPGAEDTCRRSLEEALEEPLEGGKSPHVGAGV